MAGGRGGRKQVWVSQSHLVTLAGGTFLACRAWIKLTWARAQVPFSHTEGESEICQQYPRKIGEEKWEELSCGMAASRGGAESTRVLLMWPAHSAGSGLLHLFSGMLSLQRIRQNYFHKTHLTSAQCQCAGINKKVLANRAKLWNSKFSFVCPHIYWENVATFIRAVIISDKFLLRSRMW